MNTRNIAKLFAKVADEYDKNCLDQCRPEWFSLDDADTELLQGRGGKRLLILRDFLACRALLTTLNQGDKGR